MTPEEVEARFERIERALEFLATNQAQFREDVSSLAQTVRALSEKMDRLEDVVLKTADAVASLARIVERHVSDGHGGKE